MDTTQTIGGYLIVGGAILVALGAILVWAPRAFWWIGHLPGDIAITGERVSFYFPLTTLIVLNGLLYFLLRLFDWFRQ
jgi:hypothetical protein